jgi:hypothetical protein
MERLIAKNPRNAECIFPYLGADEFLESPTQSHNRYVIFFGEMSETEARSYPDLMRIVEEKVRPVRENDNRETRRRYWWRFAELAPALHRAKVGKSRVLMHPFTATYVAFAFVPGSTIVSGPHNVFVLEDFAAFGVLQSRPHELWTRFFGSSLEDRQRYTPSDCFETFPFPAGVLDHAAGESPTTDNCPVATVETAGREYYEFRAALMVRHNQGLTKTYNRLHDRDHDANEPNKEIVAGIQKLRELHAVMDRAVLEAYGWHDLAQTATCEFLLDYEDEEDEEEPTGRARKKPWRYRWPDDFRDEVLARLLALNAHRAEEERLTGEAAEANAKPKKIGAKKATRKKKSSEPSVHQPELNFDDA